VAARRTAGTDESGVGPARRERADCRQVGSGICLSRRRHDENQGENAILECGKKVIPQAVISVS